MSLSGSTGHRTALVIFVGITAGRTERRHLLAFFSGRGFDVHLPVLPYVLGLKASAGWAARYLKRRVFPRHYDAIHFLNFIGGGFVFRALERDLQGQPIGRIVYVRSPIQEEVPRALARRHTRLGLMLFGGKTIADLSMPWIEELPFPVVGSEKGLIVETGISRMAQSLGITKSSVPAAAWDARTLLPGADDVLEVAESHDQIYEADNVLAQVLAFCASGHFDRSENAAPPRLDHAT